MLWQKKYYRMRRKFPELKCAYRKSKSHGLNVLKSGKNTTLKIVDNCIKERQRANGCRDVPW